MPALPAEPACPEAAPLDPPAFDPTPPDPARAVEPPPPPVAEPPVAEPPVAEPPVAEPPVVEPPAAPPAARVPPAAGSPPEAAPPIAVLPPKPAPAARPLSSSADCFEPQASRLTAMNPTQFRRRKAIGSIVRSDRTMPPALEASNREDLFRIFARRVHVKQTRARWLAGDAHAKASPASGSALRLSER